MARDERITLKIMVKGKEYPAEAFITRIDVDKKRVHCEAIVPPRAVDPTTKTPVTYIIQGDRIGFYIPIEFDETTKENLARISIGNSKHLS